MSWHAVSPIRCAGCGAARGFDVGRSWIYDEHGNLYVACVRCLSTVELTYDDYGRVSFRSSPSNTAVTQAPENSAKNTKTPQGADQEN